MMAESESIDSVEYVTYNYSVKRPELFICMLHFPDPPIRSDRSHKNGRSDRSDSIWDTNRIEPIWIGALGSQIGSGSADLARIDGNTGRKDLNYMNNHEFLQDNQENSH